MEWWSIFRKLRVILFAFAAVLSLTWAILSSLYLSRDWKHLNIEQRVIVLCAISVSGFTSVFMYLIIVVMFRVPVEFLRLAFLLILQIGGAVPFTIVVFDLPCVIFDSENTCKEVNMLALASLWTTTGLLVLYTFLLCIMSRVPRPIPRIKPDLFLEPDFLDRRGSVTSETGLLEGVKEQDIEQRPASPASIYSQEVLPQNTRKRFFVANGLPRSPIDSVVRDSRRDRAGPSYGATYNPAVRRSDTLASRFSASTTHSSIHSVDPRLNVSHNPFRQMGQATRPPQAPVVTQGRHLPPLTMPPTDMNSYQYPAPASAQSTSSFAPSMISANSFGQIVQTNEGFLATPDMFGANISRPSTALSTSSTGSLRPLYLQPGQTVNSPSYPGNPFVGYVGPVLENYRTADAVYTYVTIPVQTHASVPPRAHTATPGSHSIHSLAPSLHFGHEFGMTRPPPAVHVRAASDPLHRPSTAAPRIENPMTSESLLPNPYGTDVRRAASVPGSAVSAPGRYWGANAACAPAYAQMDPQYLNNAMAGQAEKQMEWKQLVLTAAAARS